MVSGHPDWQTWSGRSVGGETTTAYSFSGAIAAGVTGTVTLPAVSAGYQNIYQSIVVSCNDDTAIHHIVLVRISDLWVFFRSNFVTGLIYDFPGQAIVATEQVRIDITNNAALAKTFVGVINWVSRKV